MNLPADASNDQSNCPDGYYRRNTGMLHQIGELQPESPAAPDLSVVEGKTHAELLALVHRMACQCGYVAAMSEEETAQAMLDTLANTALKPIVQGVNMKADIASRMAAIDKWLDRTKGKSVQRIEQKVEHTSKSEVGELTTYQLLAVLREASAGGLLPGGVKLLDDGTVITDAEFEEV